ncbi:hypothetical protein Gotri_022724, partial [Gossypium trilobum]|nr:hypothetical protein [Gossypium trilobum]
MLPTLPVAGSDRIIWQWSSAGRFSSSETYKHFVVRRNMPLYSDGSMGYRSTTGARKYVQGHRSTTKARKCIQGYRSTTWARKCDQGYRSTTEARSAFRDHNGLADCMAKAASSDLNRLLMFEDDAHRALE